MPEGTLVSVFQLWNGSFQVTLENDGVTCDGQSCSAYGISHAGMTSEWEGMFCPEHRNLNMAFKNCNEDEDKYSLDLTGKLHVYITDVDGKKVVNIYDGSCVVFTLIAPEVTIFDSWDWGGG